MSGKCCTTGSLHEGEPAGEIKEVFGLLTYVAGSSSSEKVIVILSDIYGLKIPNTKLIADQFAKSGYQVFVPDILFGDGLVKLDGSVDLGAYLEKHRPEVTKPIVDSFLFALKEQMKPKFLGLIGYCFGARYVMDHIKKDEPTANAAAIAHPSRVETEQFRGIGKNPLLISAAQVDRMFPIEARFEAEKALTEEGAIYKIDLFGTVSHGFAARGDLSDPLVSFYKEKVFADQVDWFNYFSKA
ncbi:LAFA_0F12486g1_1 [Lachancea sp. 'fantastica']|nr:LAFA_0F12486g1_1 [Lachancea sp. 'fantastica']